MNTYLLPFKIRQGIWRVGAGALFALVLATWTSFAADADGDGLDDTFEIELMNRFAPIVRLHPDDEYRPATVDWYLARVTMRFNHGICGDCEILPPYGVTLSLLISRSHREKSAWPDCSHNDTIRYSWDTTPAPTDEADFFLKIPDDENEEDSRRGSLPVAVCYAHVRRAPIHHPMRYDVQYWFFYAFNGSIDPVNISPHEGDWEHITVRVEPDGQTIHRILFARHGEDEHRWYNAGGPGSGFTLIGGRPVVYSARNSHGSYPWSGTWDRGFPLPDDSAADGGPTWDCLGRTVNIGEGYAPGVGMEWIQFTGHWGNVGFDADLPSAGPHGPAFQGPWNANVVANDDPADHSWIFVDSLSVLPPGGGTWDSPFCTLGLGVAAVPSGGTIWIKPGNYTALGTYTKPMTWRPWVRGSVVLGN